MTIIRGPLSTSSIQLVRRQLRIRDFPHGDRRPGVNILPNSGHNAGGKKIRVREKMKKGENYRENP